MNGPEVWTPIKQKIDAIYGKSVIAGGCLRDYVINKNLNPKDIDFFVPVEDELELEMGISKIDDDENFYGFCLKEPGKSLDSYTAAPGELSPNIVGVLEGIMSYQRADVIINIIGKRRETIEDPSILMGDFDHSLCQFYSVDGENIVITDAAQKTLDTGVISVYTPDKNNTRKRLERLLTRSKSYSRFSIEGLAKQKLEEALKKKKTSKKDSFSKLYSQIVVDDWIRPGGVAPVVGANARGVNWDVGPGGIIIRNDVNWF